MKTPFTNVYFAALPTDEPIGALECAARMDEINAAKSQKAKREKYFVWRLLTYALQKSVGSEAATPQIKKESYGGWSVGDVFISLSHSGGALAVAVSSEPIGIDVESLCHLKQFKIAERILCDEELAEFEKLPQGQHRERLVEIWTAKEAIFKSKCISQFLPKQINTLSENFKTEHIIIDGKSYVWSAAANNLEQIKVYTDIDLKKIVLKSYK